MLTAITCTGNRPLAFKFCASYMAAQTSKEEIQWIVVTDDLDPSALVPLFKGLPKNITPELYQGPVAWEPGRSTHQGNMTEALEHVKGDKIFFFEDDDWYSPQYLEEMSKLLEFVEIAGEANSKYYNLLAPGWKRMQNYAHASLCQTAIRLSVLQNFKTAVGSGNKFFDVELWQNAHRQGKSCAMFADVNLCIGIKCMPGRAGIGVGHSVDGYLKDPDFGILKRWLGDAASNYLPLARRVENGKEEVETPRVQESVPVNKPKRGRPKGSGSSNTSVSNTQGLKKSQAQKSATP